MCVWLNIDSVAHTCFLCHVHIYIYIYIYIYTVVSHFNTYASAIELAYLDSNLFMHGCVFVCMVNFNALLCIIAILILIIITLLSHDTTPF